MGEYADVKRKKILKLLRWLETLPGFTVGHGGNHQWVVKHESWTRPFPIPFKHGVVNKHIVKDLMKKVTTINSCTEEQFDTYIK